MSDYRDPRAATRARADALDERVRELEAENEKLKAELATGDDSRIRRESKKSKAEASGATVETWVGPSAKQALVLIGVGGLTFVVFGVAVPLTLAWLRHPPDIASLRGGVGLALVLLTGSWPLAASVPRLIDPFIPSGGKDINGMPDYRIRARSYWWKLAAFGAVSWALGMALLFR